MFLVGDAAHLQSSAGGLGMNTGIQDGHNLAWKIAAVIHGQASVAAIDYLRGMTFYRYHSDAVLRTDEPSPATEADHDHDLIDPDGAVLLRPDGFVAWRASALPTDPEAVLRQTIHRTLEPSQRNDQLSG